MSEAKEILELIERVDINGTDKLDKIECLVYRFVKNDFDLKLHRETALGSAYMRFRNSSTYEVVPSYTRSRDALKAIRPDGWLFCLDAAGDDWFRFIAYKKNNFIDDVDIKHKTEELAELWAIIKAIEWEQSK